MQAKHKKISSTAVFKEALASELLPHWTGLAPANRNNASRMTWLVDLNASLDPAEGAPEPVAWPTTADVALPSPVGNWKTIKSTLQIAVWAAKPVLPQRPCRLQGFAGLLLGRNKSYTLSTMSNPLSIRNMPPHSPLTLCVLYIYIHGARGIYIKALSDCITRRACQQAHDFVRPPLSPH